MLQWTVFAATIEGLNFEGVTKGSTEHWSFPRTFTYMSAMMSTRAADSHTGCGGAALMPRARSL